jgi:ABC-type amino acid transport substrate-binding protein
MQLGACLVLASAILLAPSEAYSASLTVMAEDSSEPFSRADGTGYANDIVRAAFQAVKVDIKLDIVPYARCKKSLQEGTTPACFAMSWSPEFKGRIAFSARPLFEVYADVFRNRKDSRKLDRADDLPKGATVGIVNGYEYPDTIHRLANHGVVLERGVNEWAVLHMLARERLDSAIIMTSDFTDGSQRLREAGVGKSVTYAFRSGTMKSYIGFSLVNPEGSWARKAFNDGYDIIIKNHTQDKIKEKWMRMARP